MTQAPDSPKKPGRRRQLRLPALEIQQGPNRRVYTFAIDGKLLPEIATVSRIRRDEATKLHGYQRPENLAHIAAIRRYLDTDPNPLLPNAIVVAFDSQVKFEREKSADDQRPAFVHHGTMIIPVVDGGAEEDKPGFIVDGQQRSAAIRDSRLQEFPVCVTAFIADTHADQRSQFILFNSTKALPKGLIHELLPEASGALPAPLMVRQLPATLVTALNFSRASPLYRMIQTQTNPKGLIKDNSMLRMLESSLSNGALWPYLDSTGPNLESMMTILNNFWRAVSEVFSDAWGKPPRHSRLMHGVGIIGMGVLMDEISHTRSRAGEIVTAEEFAADLKAIADDCHWTEGTWQFPDGQRPWNGVENTSRDIARVQDYLVRSYRHRVGGRR